MALRGQWLSVSGDHASALARVGQAVLHLELSRCALNFSDRGFCTLLFNVPTGMYPRNVL